MNYEGFSAIFSTQDGSEELESPAGEIYQGFPFSTAADGGYKDASLPIVGPAGAMAGWYYMLGKRMVLKGPGGRCCWDGVVWDLNFSNGFSYSLSDIYNAVMVRYTPWGGMAEETAWATDSDSIARYGRKELVTSRSDVTATGAAQYRDNLLYHHLRSLAIEPFTIPEEDKDEPLMLDLTAYGWRATLGGERWQQTAPGPLDTGAQIRNIVAGRGGAGNGFIDVDTTTVPNTGFSIDQERVDQWMTLLAEILRLANLGDGAGDALWFQVWDDRKGYLVNYGGGDFPAVDYYTDGLGLYDKNGAQIPAWLGRADNVLQTDRHLPLGYGMYSDPLDMPKSFYLLETEYRVGSGLWVKPAGWSDFVQLLEAA